MHTRALVVLLLTAGLCATVLPTACASGHTKEFLRQSTLRGAFPRDDLLEQSAFCSGEEDDKPSACLDDGADLEEFDVNGAGDLTLQGFATPFSVLPGHQVELKINTTATSYRIDIYRVGYYLGKSARKIASLEPDVSPPDMQPRCFHDEATHLVDCAAWKTQKTWTVPATAQAGVYLARLVRTDAADPTLWRRDASPIGADPRFAEPGAEFTKPRPAPHAYGASGHGALGNALREPRASLVYFVVRSTKEQINKSDVLFQTAEATWQAYNTFGGYSTYTVPRALKSSFNRPFWTRQTRAVNILFGNELPMIRFLEAHGYNVAFVSGLDIDREGKQWSPNVYLSTGHDEYWSLRQRNVVEGWRDDTTHPTHMIFASGNEVFWQVYWEQSPVDGGTDRTMVCMKETQSSVKLDDKPGTWTGTFRDSRELNPQGPNPENALTGTIFTVNAWRNDPLTIPPEFAPLRIWRHTKVAELRPGDLPYVTIKGILGHEWDEDMDNGFRPAGLVRLSRTGPVHNLMYSMDFGSTYDSGSATHHLVMYRSKAGALVFGTGTVQWAWGLDPVHDSANGVPHDRENFLNTRIGLDFHGGDRVVQQAMVNMLTDMGAAPATVDNAYQLTMPHASTDTEAPTSSLMDGGAFIVSCGDYGIEQQVEARDTGGGVVAGVEFSFDNGKTWHPCDRNADEEDEEGWLHDITHWICRYESSDRALMDTDRKERLTRATDDSGNTELVNPAPGKATGGGNEDDGIPMAPKRPRTKQGDIRRAAAEGKEWAKRMTTGDADPVLHAEDVEL